MLAESSLLAMRWAIAGIKVNAIVRIQVIVRVTQRLPKSRNQE